MKFGVLILHYLDEKMTSACVDSILSTFGENDENNFYITLVDNASENRSGILLEEKYKNHNNIKVLFCNKNLGFAKGNNLGYEYLKNEVSVDFMIVMNNDVIIRQKDFFIQIEHLFCSSGFAVLGPDIYSDALGCHQNPASLEPMSVELAKNRYARFTRDSRHFFFYYYRRMAYVKMIRCFGKDCNLPKECAYTEEHSAVVLHGACLIFSPIFISNRSFAFNPATFLYCEEDILEAECRNAGLLMMYSPTLQVEHLSRVSTMKKLGSTYKYHKMKTLYSAESLKLLLDIIDK